MAKKNTFPLVEIIRALGEELREAERTAPDDHIVDLKDCSVQLGITWERSTEGKLSFYVFKLGADTSRANSQTITVNLSPSPTRRPVPMATRSRTPRRPRTPPP